MASFDEIAARLRGTSVPSIGSARATTLDAALARVGRAEAELATARAEARRLGRAAGKKLSALFEDSLFVKRSSAEEWMDEARSEAHIAGLEMACKHFERAFRPKSEKEKDLFYNLAQAMVRRGIAGRDIGDAPVDAVGARQAEIRASRRVDLSANRAIGAPTESAALANAILKAGARARTATDADPPRETNALSEEILRQGRRRRGEEQ